MLIVTWQFCDCFPITIVLRSHYIPALIQIIFILCESSESIDFECQSPPAQISTIVMCWNCWLTTWVRPESNLSSSTDMFKPRNAMVWTKHSMVCTSQVILYTKYATVRKRHVVICTRHVIVCTRHSIFCTGSAIVRIRHSMVCTRHVILCSRHGIVCKGMHSSHKNFYNFYKTYYSLQSNLRKSD